MTIQDDLVSDHPDRLDFADESDVDTFVAALEQFEKGELTSDQWKKFRRLRGVYEQRQGGKAMIRAKVPGGVIGPRQLRTLASVADRFAGGIAHITTRQCFQLHFVPKEQIEAALRALGEGGITTREACGDSVRNFTACPLAGVAADEPFDVTPYLHALTRHFLRGPWSSKLPRKFKPSIGGCCGTDCSQAFINDLGFLARTRDGERGFTLLAGGGLSTLRRSAIVVEEWIPAADLLEAAEAVVRVFHHHGNRDNRAKARLKFVIDKLGADAVRGLYQEQRALIRAEGGRPYTVEDPAPPRLPARLPLAGDPAPGFADWAAAAVRPQKQAGYATVRVRVTLGDVTSDQLRALATLVETHGEGELRTTNDQNLVLRWIADDRLTHVHRALVAAGLVGTGVGTVVDVTTCQGATTCQLAVTQSRGAGRLLTDVLLARPDLVARAPDLSIKVSGCPNSCGQHHVAGLGLQGGVRKVGGKAVYQYLVHLGGRTAATGARFGKLVGKVPARRLPILLERLIDVVERQRRPDEHADDVLARLDDEAIATVLAGLTELSAADATADDFVDLDDHETRRSPDDVLAPEVAA
ncbi:MAG TPA: nitrite/sulfite reductase [Kofleriaceae bacterium]|nr:nitrite/sulfite reductase [Kofleriaceae bacterium]